MIKIDLVTGFLGSGKTTFIREYARYLLDQGQRICIIENDYGAINVDMVLLQDLYSDRCNLEMIVGGDGKEAHRRRFRTKLISMGMAGYDRVIIEPSGIYDVDEFFDVLYDEPLDRWYEIGSVISMVDASSCMGLADMSRYLFMSEIAWSGKIVVTKLDEGGCSAAEDSAAEDTAAGATSEGASGKLEQITGFINKVMAEYGCNTRFDRVKDILPGPADSFGVEDWKAIENCGYKRASYIKLSAEDEGFAPLFYFDVEMPEDKLRNTAAALFHDEKAGKVIRIKGFVKVNDGNSQVEINATARETNVNSVVSSRNVLIIIGENLNKAYINEIFRDYCSVVSL